MARPKSEDKKQALLEAATAAFAQSGIAASTSAIARSAGVAEGTLFRYFATKDELLNELYLAIKLRLVRMMIAGLEVPHTHLHVLPIDDLGDLSFAKARSADALRLADEATRIRAALRAHGHKEADF